jgi:hypothetical protein
MSYFHPTVGMRHSTVHLVSCHPSPAPQPQTAPSFSLMICFSRPYFAGYALCRRKAMSLYCEKIIITFIFRTGLYLFFFLLAWDISRRQNVFRNFSLFVYGVGDFFFFRSMNMAQTPPPPPTCHSNFLLWFSGAVHPDEAARCFRTLVQWRLHQPQPSHLCPMRLGYSTING